MRAFIAITLPANVHESLGALQRELAASQADVKWVAPGQLHLTLKFLGEISEAERRAVEAILVRIAAWHGAFRLRLGGLGVFPGSGPPRVVWVGVSEGAEAVRGLAESIEQEGRAIPLRGEERPLTAHLTLGRVRSSKGRRELLERIRSARWTPPPPWLVTSVTFFESVLRPGGPQHTVLADVPIAAQR